MTLPLWHPGNPLGMAVNWSREVEPPSRREVNAARRRHEAEQRGLRLLWENITDAQRDQLRTVGYLICKGNCHGDLYHLYPRTQQNIICHPRWEKSPLRRPIGFPSFWGLCIVPEGRLVLGDVMLAQKLAIELEEKSVRRQANYLYPDLDYLTRCAREKIPLWETM